MSKKLKQVTAEHEFGFLWTYMEHEQRYHLEGNPFLDELRETFGEYDEPQACIDALLDALDESAAAPDEYRYEGLSLWATIQAIDAAIEYKRTEVEREGLGDVSHLVYDLDEGELREPREGESYFLIGDGEGTGSVDDSPPTSENDPYFYDNRWVDEEGEEDYEVETWIRIGESLSQMRRWYHNDDDEE